MSAVVLIILAEEHSGIHRTPHFAMVLALNLPWLLLPLLTGIRMARDHPFTELAAAPAQSPAELQPTASLPGGTTSPAPVQETGQEPAGP
jgi:hypothetical protein